MIERRSIERTFDSKQKMIELNSVRPA